MCLYFYLLILSKWIYSLVHDKNVIDLFSLFTNKRSIDAYHNYKSKIFTNKLKDMNILTIY